MSIQRSRRSESANISYSACLSKVTGMPMCDITTTGVIVRTWSILQRVQKRTNVLNCILYSTYASCYNQYRQLYCMGEVATMSLRLWIGGAGSGKSHELYQYVIEESQKNPATNYIVIVPEQFTLHTQRELVMMHPRHGIMNIDVLSFARLAYRVFDEVGGQASKRLVMDDMGKSLVLRRIAAEHEGELKVLGKNLRKLGYINEIKSVISEFMQYDIHENEIDALLLYASGRPMLQYKLQDIKLLYRAFTAYLQEKYTTKEELLAVLCQVIESSELVKNSVIVFDGFTGFTPIQNKLLGKLMVLSKDVHVTVLLRDTEDTEQDLFYLSHKTIASLKKIAKENDVNCSQPVMLDNTPVFRFQNNKAMAHLEQQIFRYDALSFEGQQDAIHIFEAQNPQEEMRRVCIEISRLIRGEITLTKSVECEENSVNTLRYGDIAIITGDIEKYAYASETELSKYGIPCFIDRTRGILLNPFVEYIRALIDVMVKDYSYESMFRYLKSSLSGFSQEEVDRLENYVLARGVRGRSQWNRKWIYKYKGLTTDELEAIDKLREKIMNGFADFDQKMREARTAEEYTRILYEMIVTNHVEQQLHEAAERFEQQNDVEIAREYTQIYRLVMELFDQIIELLREDNLSVREFGEILDAGFDEIRVGITPPSLDAVTVGDITRTRLRDIKVLFFVGVNDTIIPKANSTAGILSDIDREHLAEQEIELAPSARQQAYMQRLYLYMIMTKPQERLYLSYARVGADGNSMRPSYLIQTVKQLFSMLSPTNENIAWEDTIVSPEASLEDLVKGIYRPHDKDYMALLDWYKSNDQYKERVLSYIKSAFHDYQTDHISKAVANVLYGKVLENSVTRLELYAACAYSHFLHYGLRLQERELYSFEAKDMGSVFHEALEEYAALLEKSEYNWFNIPLEEADMFVERAIEICMNRTDREILYSSFRNEYAIKRIKRIMKRTVETLLLQVRKGVFEPNRFEFSFVAETNFHSLNFKLSEDEIIRLRGRIDRMDTYEDDEHVYVKIIDYKSGNQAFDLAAVYHGLQLQLVVYLNAAMELQQREHSDKEIVPAGILYYHIDDPLIEKEGEMAEEEINQKIIEQLSMKGLVNCNDEVIRLMDQDFGLKSDVLPVKRILNGEFSRGSSIASTEEFQTISNYVNHKIKDMGRNILDGDIAMNPYESDKSDACTYCNYHAVCRFDDQQAGISKRKLKKAANDEVLNQMTAKEAGLS